MPALTVEKLIRKLKKLPPGALVCVWGEDENGQTLNPATRVEVATAPSLGRGVTVVIGYEEGDLEGDSSQQKV